MAVLDRIINSLNSLLEDIVSYGKNEDIFDCHKDFFAIRRLRAIRHDEVPDILDAMFEKLELVDENSVGGRFNILITLSNFRYAENRTLFYRAINALNKENEIRTMTENLESLSVESHRITNSILTA